MGKIPQEIIDQILDKVDIVEVVSDHIQLKRAGRSFKANCPFHNEKTPSFIVSPDKQIYHCFGCGEGGNVIGFVMKYENMDFPETVKLLAARAGVELPKYRDESGEGPSLSSRLYETNKIAATFYQNCLRSEKGKRALDYLTKRGFETTILADFRIGYAPNEWESLRRYCEGKRIPADLLRKAGLTIPSEKGKGDYDRFRNRITFPIFNERGHIVGFGARVMDDSLPKYINSPETPIYSKSNVLYGLNFSKKGIREKGYAVIVEGYMDVIIPFQYGVNSAVATSGTALTPRQISMLKKYTDTAIMIFDSDQAGETASLRGLDMIIENGMKVRVVTLPRGEDPDSFVRKYGKDKFEEAIKKAKDLFDYKLDLLVKKFGAGNVGGITDELLPTISKVDNMVIQSDYLRKLAERLGIHEASLRYEMRKVKPDYSYRYDSETRADKVSRNYNLSEIHLLGLAIVDKGFFTAIRDDLGLDMFRDKNVRKALDFVSAVFREEGKINLGKLLSRFDNDEDLKAVVMQAVAKADITKDRDKVLQDCMLCARRASRDEKLKDLTSRLKKAQESNNDPEIKDLLEKINRIHKERVI
ncbi:MAG: DNA primase [Candidatus Omnitrophota bacterium]